VLAAVKKLLSKRKVGLDIFTRGGKSYIAMDLISYMLERDENKDKYVIIMAPKSVADNLEGNVMKDFEHFKQLIFMNYEKLSRKIKVTDYLKEVHIKPEKVCMIVMDEAHKAFGEICRNTFLLDKDFIYSKYIIAMTATPYSNLSGVHSLDELVGKDNIIRYHYDEAIKDKIARKINYIPAVLSYDTKVLERITELRRDYKDNAYLVQLLDKFEKINDNISSNEARAICSYLTENVKLSCRDGARVFVFFSSIAKLENGKNAVIDAVTNAYKNWGDKNVEYRYLNFTSASTDDEIDKIRDILSRDPLANTVDIICTVQMGVMGIHPSHTHFALMMSTTTSLQKLMQMIGRVTNLYAYDDTDTTVFDLRDSLAEIDKVHYKAKGKNLLQDLLDVMYGKEDGNISQYNSSVNIKSSKMANESLELLEKIRLVENTIKESANVIQYIEQKLPNIDSRENGSILDYLKHAKTRTENQLERRSLLKKESVYRQILNIVFNDEYDNDIRESLRSEIDRFEYRIYIAEGSAIDKINRVHKIYDLCKKYVEDSEITDEFTKHVLYPLSCNELADNEVRILYDFGVLQSTTKEQMQEVKSNMERINKQEEIERQRQLEEKRKQIEKEIEQKKERQIKKLEERNKKQADARRASLLYNKCVNTIKEIKSKIDVINTVLSDTVIVSDELKYYRTIHISINEIKIRNTNNKTMEYKTNVFTELKNTATAFDIQKINSAIAKSDEYAKEVRRYLRSDEYHDNFNNIELIDILTQFKNNLQIHDDILHSIMINNPYTKMMDSSQIRISDSSIIEFKVELGITGWEIDIDTHSEQEYNDKMDTIKRLSREYHTRKAPAFDIQFTGNKSNNIIDIINSNKESYDRLMALFTQILYKHIKVHVTKEGGSIFSVNYDISDKEVKEYTNELNNAVGKQDSNMIINSAKLYLENENIKFIIDTAFGNIDTDNIKQTIESSISAYNYIKNTTDSVTKNILIAVELDEDIRSKIVSILRQRCGFDAYERLITPDGSYITDDKEIQNMIHKKLSKEIKENLGVALYYAIENNNKFLMNEIFTTGKYENALMTYAVADKKYSSFVSNILGK
jgi:hypothetical protein